MAKKSFSLISLALLFMGYMSYANGLLCYQCLASTMTNDLDKRCMDPINMTRLSITDCGEAPTARCMKSTSTGSSNHPDAATLGGQVSVSRGCYHLPPVTNSRLAPAVSSDIHLCNTNLCNSGFKISSMMSTLFSSIVLVIFIQHTKK